MAKRIYLVITDAREKNKWHYVQLHRCLSYTKFRNLLYHGWRARASNVTRSSGLSMRYGQNARLRLAIRAIMPHLALIRTDRITSNSQSASRVSPRKNQGLYCSHGLHAKNQRRFGRSVSEDFVNVYCVSRWYGTFLPSQKLRLPISYVSIAHRFITM